MKPRRFAFTLLELLVCIGVVAILAAVAFPLLSSLRKKGSMSREIASARKLVAAHAAYTAEHDGELLPGFGNFPAKDERGEAIQSPVNYRYPWRLAPYMHYDMRAFWGTESDDNISKLAKGARDQYVYAVSVEPALGINATFVGGDYQVLPPDNLKALQKYGQFCVTRFSQASNAQRLIVFASAAGQYDGKRLPGYFKVEAPNFQGRNWSGPYQPGDNPELHGHVDFRYEGKAVVAMLDGHVEMMDFEHMNDMRLWSNQAASAQNRTWHLGSPEEPESPGSMVSLGTEVTTLPEKKP